MMSPIKTLPSSMIVSALTVIEFPAWNCVVPLGFPLRSRVPPGAMVMTILSVALMAGVFVKLPMASKSPPTR